MKTYLILMSMASLILLAPVAEGGTPSDAKDKSNMLSSKVGTITRPLQAWDNRVQKELSALLAKGEGRLLSALGENGLWDILRESKELRALEAQMAPLYKRFEEADYDIEKLGTDDRALLDTLRSHDLYLELTEGMPFLMLDNNRLYERVEWSSAAQVVVKVLKQQPSRLIADGGLCYSVEEMGRLALLWDELVNKNGTLAKPLINIVRARYSELLDLMLWCDMPNTPAFPRHEGGRMPKEWRVALQKVADSAPDSDTAKLINTYLKQLKANGWTLNKSIRKETQKRIKDIL